MTHPKQCIVQLSKIIEFVSEYEDDIDRARRIIYDFEKGKSEIEDAYETIENYFGDGFVTEYSTGTVQKNERFDRRTKRGKSKSDAYHSNFRKATIEKARRIAGFVEDDKQYSDRDVKGNQLTDAQVEYFEDSKVRDGKGSLKVVYHGTTRNFTTFRMGDIGYHFGNKSTAQNRVGRGKGTVLMECYLVE